MKRPPLTHCPACDRRLECLATWCPDCKAYTEDMLASTTDTTPPNREEEASHDRR